MKKLFWIGILVYLSVLLVNDGFMASDEYWDAMTRYLPAQQSQLNTLVNEQDVKSPLQMMPMYFAAKMAYALGIDSIYYQYRIVIFVIGLINVLLLAWALTRLAPFFKEEKKTLWALFIFYFAAPFALTRPMYEALAAPWLLLSFTYALIYLKSLQTKDLLWSTFFVSVAFALRQQVGICALAVLYVAISQKKWSDLAQSCVLGFVLFLLIGLPDYFLRGEFHLSFKAATIYNFKYGHEYGNSPWYTYFVMMGALTLCPFFIRRYPNGFFKNYFQLQKLNWIFILLFVLLHNLFPQKFERFLVSIIPLLLLALLPFLHQLYIEKEKYIWRWRSLLALNGFLFVTATYFPAQKNIISLSLYLNSKSEVKSIYSVENSLSWITDLFIQHDKPAIHQITQSEMPARLECQELLVVNSYVESQLGDQLKAYRKVREFPVNVLEMISYKLNPKNNQRRSSLTAYGCVE